MDSRTPGSIPSLSAGEDDVLLPDVPLPECLVRHGASLDHEGGPVHCPAGQLLLSRGNPQSDPHNPHHSQQPILENVEAGTRRGETFTEPTEQKQRARARPYNLYVRRVLIYCLAVVHQTTSYISVSTEESDFLV